MATQVQRRGGSTSEHNTFTGAARELTIDTTKQTVVVHDGSTVGGHPLQKQFPPVGSAAAPTYTFTGDTNTGIYSPGADQVAISTNGTGRLFVDASGNVGLGLSNPSYPLEVASSADSTINITGGTSNLSRLFFSDTTLARGFLNYDHASDSLRIGTAGSEQMRLTSAGLLGLGTSSPGSIFEAKGNSPQLIVNSTTASYPGLVFQTNGVSDGGILYNGSGDKLEFYTGDTSGNPEVVIDASGRLGIGVTSPSANGNLTVVMPGGGNQTGLVVKGVNTGGAGSQPALVFEKPDGTKNSQIISDIGSGYTEFNHVGSGSFIFTSNANERFRCDSLGRLLVGTSSDFDGYLNQVSSTSGSLLSLRRTNSNPGSIKLSSGASGDNVGNGGQLGYLRWYGFHTSADYEAARIAAEVDGVAGVGDMPGRLVFSTTSDNSASPVERARITSGGYFKASNTGGYVNGSGSFHELNTNNASATVSLFYASSGSYAENAIAVGVARAANSAYSFFAGESSAYTATDKEFNLRGDGNAFADGSWSGGGADYAEYFEWSDGNPDADDRRGIAVVLDGDKIRPALAGEDPIGVISGNPSVVGDSAWNKWSGKYLRDEFGAYIQEDYEVVNDEGETVVQQRRKLNPAYDPDVEYTSREERPEWDCVGLMGKLRLRKGQPTGSRWIKMRDISATVEEWLVR
jgi:hypothetical protein